MRWRTRLSVARADDALGADTRSRAQVLKSARTLVPIQAFNRTIRTVVDDSLAENSELLWPMRSEPHPTPPSLGQLPLPSLLGRGEPTPLSNHKRTSRDLALGTLNFAAGIDLPALVSLDRRAAPGTRA